MGLLDTIAPTPRNKLLGLLADAAQGVSDFAAKPFGYNNPPGELVAGLLGVPDIAKTLDRLSYGEPLTTGTGMTLRLRDEAVNAAMAALPLGATLGKGAIDAGVYAAQKAAPAIERVVPRIMKRGGLPAEILRGMSQQTVSPLTVWHGSPHKFDKFDSGKIGTGEGAQAYGHGLYLAESPDVAKAYQDKLTDPAFKYVAQNEAKARLNEKIAQRVEATDPVRAAKLRADVSSLSEPGGALYKVDLPDEHIAKMLDWDKPLSEQEWFKNTPSYEDLLATVKAEGRKPTKQEILLAKIKSPNSNLSESMTGENLYSNLGRNAEESAKNALEYGFPGIRYLDGGSRGTGAGTSNFVVFPGNEKILKILERNGKPVGLLGN